MTSASPSPARSLLSLRDASSQNPHPSTGTILRDGHIGNETAELLRESVYSPQTSIEDLPNLNTFDRGGMNIDKVALEAQRGEHAARPWWRRASATWFFVLCPLSAIAISALIAPRLQLFTNLVCKELDGRQWDPAVAGAGRNAGFVGTTRPVPCAADPAVQANVTKLLTVMATVQGVLSCLTAAFWGSFSDRYGRVWLLSFNIVPVLLADAVLVALAIAPEKVPGGYWFLVFTAALEGLIGGSSAGTAAFQAYIADCSDPGTRSRIFSRVHGLLFAGLALGPTIGGLAEHLSGKPYVVFYIALVAHVIIACFFWFITPESLLPAQMDAARRVKRASNEGYFSSWASGFFAPLTVFAPVAHKGGVTPQKSLKKDWSLTWLAFSFAPDSLVMGGIQYSLQYAAGKYNWTGEMIGYYISAAAVTRALYLVLGLPALLRFFASKRPAVQLPVQPGEPLDARSESPSLSAREDTRAPVHANKHTPALDLGIAKASLAIHAVSFVLIAVSKNAVGFVAAGLLATFSIGYGPVVQSLSLELYALRGGETSEAGRLFGAMNVIQTLGNQIIGPSLFGVVYMKTVATFPEAMFYVFMAVVLLSLSFLFLVQIPPGSKGEAGEEGVEVEAPISGVATPLIVLNDEEEAFVHGH